MRRELRAKEPTRLGEAWYSELIGVCGAVREIEPQRHVGGRAVASTGTKSNIECSKAFGDIDCPSTEDVGDDAERRPTVLLGDFGNEVMEGRLERLGGIEEVDDMMGRQGVCVFRVWW